LNPAQLKAVDDLVARGRLAVVPADRSRALTFLTILGIITVPLFFGSLMAATSGLVPHASR
jgi:hypothetical protein